MIDWLKYDFTNVYTYYRFFFIFNSKPILFNTFYTDFANPFGLKIITTLKHQI